MYWVEERDKRKKWCEKFQTIISKRFESIWRGEVLCFHSEFKNNEEIQIWKTIKTYSSKKGTKTSFLISLINYLI
jgi:hypothetical protein